jgi:hypothetical protein
MRLRFIRESPIRARKEFNAMKRFVTLVLALICLVAMVGCSQNTDLGEKRFYTYEELDAMPADKLLELFIENGLVINDDLKANHSDEQLQALFKTGFYHWHKGSTPLSHTMYFDLAKKTKDVYDKIAVPQE